MVGVTGWAWRKRRKWQLGAWEELRRSLKAGWILGKQSYSPQSLTWDLNKAYQNLSCELVLTSLLQ